MQNTFFLILNGLAAAATTIAVGFAGFQFWSDRQVRAVQAQMTAIELLLPRYSWRKNAIKHVTRHVRILPDCRPSAP